MERVKASRSKSFKDAEEASGFRILKATGAAFGRDRDRAAYTVPPAPEPIRRKTS